MKRLIGSMALTLLGALLGCGGVTRNPGSTSTASTSVATGTGGEGGGATGSIRVIAVATTFVNGQRTNPPAANAAVAIDLPGGERAEGTTDATGHVTFSGIDWSKGDASVSGFLDASRVIYGVSDVNPSNFADLPVFVSDPDADVVLYLFQRGSAVYSDLLQITLVGEANADDVLTGFAPNAAQYARDTVPFLGLYVAPASTYSVTMLDATKAGDTIRWAAFSGSLPMTPTPTITLDLAQGGTTLVPNIAQAHVVIPGGSAGPFGANSTALVQGLTDNQGAPPVVVSKSALTAAHDALDVTIEYVDEPGAAVTYHSFGIQSAAGSYALRTIAGPFDTSSVTVDGFLLPPVVKGSTVDLSMPISVTADPTTTLRFFAFDSGTENIWVNDCPPGHSTIHLAAPPASAQFVLDTEEYGEVVSVADADAAVYRSIASSSVFRVKRPASP